ncbi:MAG: hypothetical protein H8F28_20010 [Fibrella sp.]|nr:hypothetical protein [Armatimonadota bacterium]
MVGQNDSNMVFFIIEEQMAMTESQELSRRWFLSLLSGGALAMTLTGCGGSGTNDGGGGNDAGGDSNDLSPDAHFDAQSAISGFINSLPAQDMGAMQQKVLEFMRGRSEITDSGLCESGVWAMFKNGFPHAVLLNRAPVDLDDSDTDFSRAAGTGVPKEGDALLMNGMVSPGYANEAARILPALAKGDYNPRERSPSVNELRDIGTPSFFFYSSHGGPVVGVGGVPYFVLSTATVVTKDLTLALLPEAKIGLLWSVSVPNDTRTFYAVTHRWISRYWKFAPSSLVWISACSSQSPAAQEIVQACIGVGAGAVAGYTDVVSSTDSDRVQRFMIDRLVGANVLSPKEATPQRSFDYDKLLVALAEQVGNSFPARDPMTNEVIPGKFVSLRITKGVDNFGLLAPSIAYVLIDETTDKAILKGTFGMETGGKVLIDGVESAVEQWGENEVRCNLPRSGAGSAGDVQVIIREHKSNVRRISRWTIEGKYDAQPSLDEPFQIEGGMRLVFRADVGEYRADPGKVFIRPTRYAIATRDSSAELSAKGIVSEACSEGGGSETRTWSGEGSWFPLGFNAAGQPPQDRGIIAYLSIDTINMTGALAIGFGFADPNSSPFRQTVNDCDGNSFTTPIPPFPPSIEPVEMRIPTEESDVVFPVPGKTFAIGGGWDIPGDKMSSSEINTTFEWISATAEFPPDPQAARSR